MTLINGNDAAIMPNKYNTAIFARAVETTETECGTTVAPHAIHQTFCVMTMYVSAQDSCSLTFLVHADITSYLGSTCYVTTDVETKSIHQCGHDTYKSSHGITIISNGVKVCSSVASPPAK